MSDGFWLYVVVAVFGASVVGVVTPRDMPKVVPMALLALWAFVWTYVAFTVGLIP